MLDDYGDKRSGFYRHAIKVAKRQSVFSGVHWFRQLVYILFYKMVSAFGAIRQHVTYKLSKQVQVVDVDNVNSQECVSVVRQYGADVICLMGTRILNEATLSSFDGIRIINIHSADPRFMRGSPAVFWEILDGRYSIQLTIHEVVSKLDAGNILMEREIPIKYRCTLGATVNSTMSYAVTISADLFRDVLIAIKNDNCVGLNFDPSKIYVTPSVVQTIIASIACLKRC